MREITTVPQHTASLHRYVAGDLLHPQFARVNGDAGDIHPAALKVDEKRHVVGHQPAQRQHLRSKEVGPRQQRQVGSDEDRPRGRTLALPRGRQCMALQNIANRLIGNHIPEIGQGAHNPVIAPVPVLARHANDQLLHLALDPRSTRATTNLRAIEFAGDQLAVPSQDSVRPGDGCYLGENLAAHAMTNFAERGSLGIDSFSRPFNWAFRMRFSAARYSFRVSNSWSTVPVT